MEVLFSMIFIFFTTGTGIYLLYDFINTTDRKFLFEPFVGIIADFYINSSMTIAMLLRPFIWKYIIIASPIINIFIIIIVAIIYRKEFYR